ncbi:unnamed protein product [Ceratitis capitata]|uniref:(Mediterranean fruit fly) hypothetical protein n=1 Tax=Ceratitis capitata TaxID=7213 RepID=A0A811UF46_CERCA|nr:unnamed protein product [Ceratitis capitata]
MPESHRNCQITWDEISVKKDLVYNNHKDVTDGFIDNDDGKSTVNSKKLIKLIKDNIDIVKEIALNVKEAVSDQGLANQSVLNLLEITENRYHYNHKGAKIHFMCD